MISPVNFRECAEGEKVRRLIKDAIGPDKQCYVLLTCAQAQGDGELQVEMSYEGDPILAAYLLEGAQGVIDGHLRSE